MSQTDIFLLFQWWSIFFVFGIAFFPFSTKIFSLFIDKGYIFSKIIGIVIVSYCILLLGVLHLVPFTRSFAILIGVFLGVIFFSTNKSAISLLLLYWKKLFLEEVIFLIALFFWAYIRTHQPDIYGLEKYMDFGFVNSILRSTYFPPKDMWFTPFAINYYYFGHFITAVLTKISGIPSSSTYNLMLASLFAFTFTLSYSFIENITAYLLKETGKNKLTLRKQIFTFLAGLVTAALVSMGGNLHILYIFFTPYKNDNPLPLSSLSWAPQTIPNAYWYPNATRFIYNTIHEFPLYSFVVSDLHGHVLDIPIVLTIIGFLLHLFLSRKITFLRLLFLSFFLSAAYMTNAWDGAIYILLSIFIIIYIHIVTALPKGKKIEKASLYRIIFNSSFMINTIYDSLLIIAGFFIFSLPFSLFFQTGAIVHGIGILCAPQFLTNLQHIGPFLFEADHCQKSPLWQLLILYGFFYFFVLSFILFLTKIKKILKTDFFILLLVFLATILITIPEFLYMKDIYPAHYRANTMFKLTYEAFILLSLVSGYIIIRIVFHIELLKTKIGRIGTVLFLFFTILLVSLVLLYPSFAINSYYANLKDQKTLDGTTYLKALHPDDYAAIGWINTHIKNQPVIVEAQGDSYTDYARISTNTGLPTILGWTVHEWLWRGSYDIPSPRIVDVQTIYETKNGKIAKQLLRKYNASYIYVGDLERTKYTKLSEKKFKSLGKIIFHHGNTRIYKLITAS